MSLSRNISEINGDFNQKLQNSPVYFAPPYSADGGIGAWSKKKLEW